MTLIFASQVLSGLGLKYEEFVDLCILMGCDYMGTIKGIYVYMIVCMYVCMLICMYVCMYVC
mgnify:CR=1 FL=1